MRVGTWNMQGRWTPEHQRFLLDAECDVWLLTEVNDRVELPGWNSHRTAALMAQRRAFAAVLSPSDIVARPDPHPATASCVIGHTTYWSSVLPWRSCPGPPIWIGPGHADKTRNAVQMLVAARPAAPLVWGGDWNHALTGREYVGSAAGRAEIATALGGLGLRAHTTALPHQIEGLLSIDHVAVQDGTIAGNPRRLHADGLSDHDGYTLEIDQRT